MSDSLNIKAPQGYLTGFPIQVEVPVGTSTEKPKVIIKSLDQGTEYGIAVRQGLKFYEGEVVFSIPGNYEIVMGDFKKQIVVKQSEILDFGTEFGIFTTATCVLLLIMIVWLKKRKKLSKAAL